MVGERDVVEVIIFVVGVEGAPGTILALHPQNPFAGARQRSIEVPPPGQILQPIHRHGDDGGVIDVRIVRIGVLKGPAAGTKIGPSRDPVAAHVEDLFRGEPIEAALDLGGCAGVAGFQ